MARFTVEEVVHYEVEIPESYLEAAITADVDTIGLDEARTKAAEQFFLESGPTGFPREVYDRDCWEIT